MPKKDIAFVGTALEDLRTFPLDARREAGSSSTVSRTACSQKTGSPCQALVPEFRRSAYEDESGAYRVIYVAKFTDAVYVLHAFQKKTQKTAKSDIDLAAKRYAEVLKEQRK